MNEFLAVLKSPLLERISGLLPDDPPVYLVGGAVRDALLGRRSYDIDLATHGAALKIGRKLADDLDGAYYPLDPQRKVARIILKPGRLGLPDARRDIKVDISRFQGATLEADLAGRDFTVNAMATDIHSLEKIIDPLRGGDDLLAKRLQACSAGAITNDPVRILRGVRFSVDLGLKILPETLAAMRSGVPELRQVSPERLRDELFRILVLARPGTSLRLLDMLGALEYVLPEVSALKQVEQGAPHVLDVWEHTLDLLNRLESLLSALAPEFDPEKAGSLGLGLAVLRLGRYRADLAEHLDSALNPERPHRGLLFLAGLYHDVGKLSTRSVDDKGAIRFLGHDQVGAGLAEARARELRLSNPEIGRLVTIVGHHMRPGLLSHPAEPPSKKAVYHFFRDTGAAGVDICLLSLADVLATYGAALPPERWERHLDVVRTLLGAWWEDKAEKVLPSPVVDGDVLMDELGLASGPLVGYLLEAIREAQVMGEVHDRAEALDLAKEILQEGDIQGKLSNQRAG